MSNLYDVPLIKGPKNELELALFDKPNWGWRLLAALRPEELTGLLNMFAIELYCGNGAWPRNVGVCGVWGGTWMLAWDDNPKLLDTGNVDGPDPIWLPVILAKYNLFPHPSSGGSNISSFLLQSRIVPVSSDLYLRALTPKRKYIIKLHTCGDDQAQLE